MSDGAKKMVQVIAIDGPAGVGKSTVAPLVAKALGLVYLDTGAMYRGVAYLALEQSIDLNDEEEVSALADRTRFDFKAGLVLADGLALGPELRTDDVSRAVSVVAANAGVRRALVAQQRSWIEQRCGGVLDGRDMGTVVFPDATLKIYLVADIQTRAKRRAAEGLGTVEEVSADIERRDYIDSNREATPLRAASDAVCIDTSQLTITEVVDNIVHLFKERVSG